MRTLATTPVPQRLPRPAAGTRTYNDKAVSCHMSITFYCDLIRWVCRTDGINGSAANVLTGQARPVVASGGVPPSQGVPGTNKWISNGLPATLSLSLEKPASIAQVQLTFDTGMHRKLVSAPTG